MAWQVQTDQPLFPELIWDQPQAKAQQPRLLIVGGRQRSLAGPLKLYQQLRLQARLTVAVPDVWQKRLPQPPPEVVFCPTNPSGSLAGRGLDQLLALIAAADSVIIGSSIGANQETVQLAQNLASRSDRPVILTEDLVRNWPAGELIGGNQIAAPDLVGLSQLLEARRPGQRNWNQLDQQQLKTVFEQPELEPLNLVISLAKTTWVKIGSNMCYNIGQIRGEANPSPLTLAGWVGLLAASQPNRLFAAAVTASHRAIHESD